MHRNWPSTNQSGQPDIDGLAHTQLTAAEVLAISKVRLKYGPAVTLIDLSSGEAQIETTNLGLQPGAMVTIEMTGPKGRRAIHAEVLGCQLASLQPQLIYRVALGFTRPIDLEDLGFEVEPVLDDLDPAFESARLEQLLTRLLSDPSERLTSQGVRTPMFHALATALATVENPAGRRAGPPLAAALAGLLKTTTDFLSTAPTSTAFVAAVEEQLRQAVTARAIGSTGSFRQLPGSDVLLLTIPSLDHATPLRQLVIEFAEGREPLERHFQLLPAGVQLLAIAHELGRLNGYNRPLVAFFETAREQRAGGYRDC